MMATVKYFLCLLMAFPLAHSNQFSDERIQRWIEARCGSGPAIWAYEGTLYDPLDGRRICQVEGMELIRQLPGPKTGLVATDLEKGTTVFSRKIFCYKSNGKLLESIKLRPNSPRREIPTNQAAAIYDTATTFSSRKNGEQLVVHTEFPNGKCYWATTETASGEVSADISNDSSLEFTVYTKRRTTDLPTMEETTVDGVVVAPKRSRILQFGASPKVEIGRFGARESYSYSVSQTQSRKKGWKFWEEAQNKIPLCSLKYSRYGEGPPWYGPGKYCSLELRGRRIDNLQDALPIVRNFAFQIPNFFEVNKEICTDEEAQQAVAWFRKEGIQLEDTTSNVGELKSRAILVWKKLRSASSHVAGKFS